MYKESNVRSDFGTGVADNCLYVRFDTGGVCKALQTARRWGHPECRTLTFVNDCLRLNLVLLANGCRIFLAWQ